MQSAGRLTTADRRFFSRIAAIVFMNPFAPEREACLAELLAEIACREGSAGLPSILPELSERIGKLESRGLGTIQRFDAHDRPMMEGVFLYRVYHRFVEHLDRLIERQIEQRAGDMSFADELLRQLGTHGFSDHDAERYFAIFYQLRRAFFFIVKSLQGESAGMRKLRAQLWAAVFTNDMRVYDRHLVDRMEDFSTLLLGETGTGKGSAAAAIGRSAFIPYDRSKRRFAINFTKSFVAINLSQFPESLIESELFGHRRGAFSGAVENHDGVFALCSPHGALFLDEIGDVAEPIQIKLLRVLQERSFSPVGSHDALRFAGRVIAATNHPLTDLRRQGRFRDDFFYRLCSDVITVPPLRQRIHELPSELEQLVVASLERITGERSAQLSDRVLSCLRRDLPPDYGWPGNVRELEQAVRRVLLTGHYIVEQPAVAAGEIERLTDQMRAGTLTADDLLRSYLALLHRRFGTYEEVGRRAKIDRRTARKYLVN